MPLDAAAQGAGVLLAHNIMAHDDLQSGRLVSPIDLCIKSGRGYFLVGLEGVEERPSVAKFLRLGAGRNRYAMASADRRFADSAE